MAYLTYSIQKHGLLGRMLPTRQDEPDWMNCDTRSPVACVAEGVWDHFEHDIVRAIHIGVDCSATRCAEEPTLHPLAHILRVMFQLLTIEKTALAGIALLRAVYSNAHQSCFILQHRDEAGMGHHDKRLIGPLVQCHSLLPAVILADHQCADAMGDKCVNNTPTGDMRVTIYLALTLVGEYVQPM
jgi:hypothetical protein